MLRTERERLRHVTELAEAASAGSEALAPEDGEGAAALVGRAERALAGAGREVAPELARAAAELRDAELRLRETALELRSFLDSLEAEPDRLEQVEAELERIAETKRRFRCATYERAPGPGGGGARGAGALGKVAPTRSRRQPRR